MKPHRLFFSDSSATRQNWARFSLALTLLVGSSFAHGYPFVYFTGSDLDASSFVAAVDVKSNTVVRSVTNLPFAFGYVGGTPVLSPDGSQGLATASIGRPGSGAGTTLLKFDTAYPNILANVADTALGAGGAYTPDGKLAYLFDGPAQKLMIFSTQPWEKLGEVNDLRLNEQLMGFTMSPDGKRTYLAGEETVFVIDMRAKAVITTIPGVGNFELITLDGARAIASPTQHGPRQNYLVDLRTFSATPMPIPAGLGNSVMAPDGNRLYFFSYDFDHGIFHKIIVFDLRTLSSSVLATLIPGYSLNFDGISITPDGARLLVTSYSYCGEGGEATWFQAVDTGSGSVALIGPPEGLTCVRGPASFTPDSRNAFFFSGDGIASVDMTTSATHYFGPPLATPPYTATGLAVSPLSLRCSHDWKVDGADRICTGGSFKNKLWGYVWPPELIRKVDFYLDGKFHRTEGYPPFELDGGAATGLSNGPHELRAVLQFKDGSKPMTLTSTFDVGQPPLRCSADALVDGNDQACDAGTFNKPLWIYWWPNTGVKSVDFYLDGKFRRTERQPPYEFGGGAATNLARGGHDIRAVVKFNDGRQTLTVNTTVIRQ